MFEVGFRVWLRVGDGGLTVWGLLGPPIVCRTTALWCSVIVLFTREIQVCYLGSEIGIGVIGV